MVHFLKVKSKDHIHRVVDLANLIWREYYADILQEEQIEYMLSTMQSENAISQQIHEDGYEYYILSYENLLCGYTGFYRKDNSLFLSKIYVLDRFRGKGVGKRVIRFLIEFCQKNDLDSIELTVNKHNENTIEFYNNLGFKRTGELVQDIGNGFVMDDFCYSLPVAKQDTSGT